MNRSACLADDLPSLTLRSEQGIACLPSPAGAFSFPRSMDLIIVIVSFNTRELLADCLNSVYAGLTQSDLLGQVWVVDNASSDGSAEMVQRKFPSARLVSKEENLGFARANNEALQDIGPGLERQTKYVLFLNPDARVVGDALGVMTRFLDETSEAGAAGARLVHGDGNFQHSAFSFPGLAQIFLDFFPIHHRLVDSRLNGRYPQSLYGSGDPFEVDHPLGAALMVRSETLAELGGFDDRFFMYCEEIDLCRRIRFAGWQIYCVPEATIVHLVGQSTGQFRHEMFVALWRSRFLMYGKHESPAFRWAARRLVQLGLWAEARRARAAFRRGETDRDALERQLAAFREIASL
ncbi:glycosyltransferase family 2 protein [Chloroflexota bacterium]